MFAFKDKHMWPFNIEKLYIWNGVDREVCGIVMGWVLIRMSKAHILRHQGPLLKQLPRRRYKEESPLSSPPLLPFPAELPHLSHVRAAGRCTPVFSSVQFSHSVLFDSLWPHGLQHARLPCPSPIPGACSNSCPSSWWCHPSISSSVVPCSSPASRSFPVSHFFTSGGQSIGASASVSVLPMNIRADFLYDWLVWSPCSPRSLLKSLLQHHSSKASILWHSVFFMSQLSHPYLTTGKTIALTRQTFVGK